MTGERITGEQTPESISVANSKGGVGKTATSAHLGAALALLGFNTLLMDLDRRAGLTNYFELSPFSLTTSDVLSGAAGIEEAAIPIRERLWLVPATPELERTELELARGNGGEMRLKRAFRRFEWPIDFVLFDCPGDWSVVTRNAVLASKFLLVPLNSEPAAHTFAVQTVASAMELAEIYAHDLSLLGVLLTRYRQTTAARAIEAQTCGTWPTEVFETRIRQAEAVNELAILQQTTSDVRAKEAGRPGEDYGLLAQEILTRTGKTRAHKSSGVFTS